MDDVILAGIGNMGSRWAEAVVKSDKMNLRSVVDNNPNVEEFVSDLESNWYSEIQDVDASHDIWIVATPPEHHSQYILSCIRSDADILICEKPTTDTFSNSEQILNESDKSGTEVQTDYIERKEPVVEEIISDIDSSFNPTRIFHWRGKVSRSTPPYMRDDLGHDISEIELLYDTVGEDFEDLEVTDVSDLQLWKESWRDENYEYDVSASIHMSSEDTDATVRGGFDERESRRYFLWIDDTKEIAYFANTLSSDELTPVSARISGSESIEDIYQSCVNGDIITDDDIQDTVLRRSDEVLHQGSSDRLSIILDELSKRNYAPCSFSTAVNIERKLRDAYREAGLSSYF